VRTDIRPDMTLIVALPNYENTPEINKLTQSLNFNTVLIIIPF